MKKKVVFWVVILLVNAAIGFVSVRTFRDLDARIATFETNQKNYYTAYAEMWNVLGLDSKYDFNNILVKEQNLENFFNYKVYVRTTMVLEVPDKLKELISGSEQSVTKINEAPAIIIGRYVLMASHVSDAEIFSRQTIGLMTPEGVVGITISLKILKYNMVLLAPDGSKHSLKELYRNKKKDFALFEIRALPKGGQENISAPNFPFEIGKSDELKIGHFIYLNGKPEINSEVARPGFITSLVSATPISALEVKKDNNEFGISQSTDQGDSGSPIVAFRDGQPELVGIYLGWIGGNGNGKNTRSRALKINVAADEIKEKLGFDLREIQRGILYKY
ncbi:MAG: trypsin-like peptidase domain-containing protein [Parcubacteria group bacterium]|nr:trypsin-like peptidase domain-containing protein [Parcubacteria group bacterium]